MRGRYDGAMTPATPLTLVEELELLVPFAEFAAAAQALLQRLEAEGVRALASMQLYGAADATRVGLIIRFSDSSAVMEHVRMISGWDDFRRFATMIRLLDMRIFGTLDPGAEAWIRQFNGPLQKFETRVAGFTR